MINDFCLFFSKPLNNLVGAIAAIAARSFFRHQSLRGLAGDLKPCYLQGSTKID
jgi:hypothetical protein